VNILTLIFAGDVDTSGNVDNAGFLPVFPPTNSNDTGKSSGNLAYFLSSPLQNFYLHKISSKGNFKIVLRMVFCRGTQPQSLSLSGEDFKG
jgi:hypothetical protein